jgi:hypothetical protein
LKEIREERTKKENAEIMAKGEKPIRPREILPANIEEQKVWLSNLFGKQRWSDMAISQTFPIIAAGRKINDLINTSKELDIVRNKIAHTILREGPETYSIDDGSHIREVHTWLPLCKCLAVYLLKREYPQLTTQL